MAPHTDKAQEAGEYRAYTGEFLNGRGKKISCYYWEPQENPRALLLICHGFTDHTMMYESLAKEMVKKGFFVFANDHAGHGRSEGPRAHMNSIHHLVDDTTYHIEKVKKMYPDTALFMWGHSMGGAISFLTYLQKKTKVDGIVAVAPALAPNPETATYVRVTLAKLLGSVLPHFPLAYADVKLSCRNPEQIEKMNTDPLRHHGYFKARASISLLKAGEEILKKKESIDVPYLLLHGDCDKVCDIIGSEILHKSSPSKDKTFIAYPGAYHSLFQEPEVISSDVFRGSVQWLEERI